MDNDGRRVTELLLTLRARLAIGAWAFALLVLPAAASGAQLQEAVRATPRAARDITLGSPVSSTLDQAKPFEDYRLRLAAGDSVQIEMQSPVGGGSRSPTGAVDQTARSAGFDTVVELLKAELADPVAVDDDGGGGSNSRLVFTAPSDGEYIIRARSFSRREVGSYVLTVTALARAPRPTPLDRPRIEDDLGANSPIIAIFDAPARYALYWVRATQGERIRLHVASSTSGPILELLNTSGSTLGSFTGAGQEVKLIAVIPETGRYLVRVAIPSAETAHYALDIERSPPRGRGPRIFVQIGHDARDALTLASNISLKADGSGEADFFYQLYFLAVLKEHPVTVIVDSSEFDPVVEGGEVDTLGFVSWVSVDSVAGRTARLVLQPFQDGNVYIRVRSTGLAIGAFRIQIVPGISRPPT